MACLTLLSKDMDLEHPPELILISKLKKVSNFLMVLFEIYKRLFENITNMTFYSYMYQRGQYTDN